MHHIGLFMVLQKLHVWEKCDSQIVCKKALDQSYCTIFKCLLTGRWLCAFKLQIRIIKGNCCAIKCSLYCKLFCFMKCMKTLPMEKMYNDKEVLELKVIEI